MKPSDDLSRKNVFESAIMLTGSKQKAKELIYEIQKLELDDSYRRVEL